MGTNLPWHKGTKPPWHIKLQQDYVHPVPLKPDQAAHLREMDLKAGNRVRDSPHSNF